MSLPVWFYLLYVSEPAEPDCSDPGDRGGWDSVSLVKGQYEEWNCLLCRDPLIRFTDTLFFKETKINSILTVIYCTPTLCKTKTLDQM